MPPMPRSAACMATSKSSSADARALPAGDALMRWLWFALGWVMLRIHLLPPLYPCLIAAVFTVWSAVVYIRQGLGILHASGHARQ